MIVEKEYLLNNLKERQESLCGIYFLLKNKEVVYVGQTTNFHQRIGAHKEKDYDSYCFVKVEQNELDKAEIENIMLYKPIYNKQLNSEMISLESIKNRLKKLKVESKKHNKRNIMNLIKNNDIEFFYFDSLIYIRNTDFDFLYMLVK